MPLKTDLSVERKTDSPTSVRGFLGLISFSTILPLNIHTNIEEMASFTWLWPIIGGFIGILVGLVGFVSMNLLHIPQLLSAGLVYSFAIWFTGFHHLDGLIDFGDAVMAHGDPQKRIDIMRDMRVGTGGIAYFFIVAIITFTSIASAPLGLIFFIILVSEVAAKLGLLTCSTFSAPFTNGTGKYFIESMNQKMLLLSLIITLAIGYLVLNTAGVVGIIGGLLGGILMAVIVRIKFNYATGDILGASNEISRMIALLLMVSYMNIM